MLTYHQLLNGVMLSKTQLIFCKLCLSEKFYMMQLLSDPNLLNKKSELVITCHHQSKLLLKCFKKNQWIDILFSILVVLYLMCQYFAIYLRHTYIFTISE